MSRLEWIALSCVRGIGARTMTRLLDQFGTPEAILTASATELQSIPGIGEALSSQILAINLELVEKQLAHWHDEGIRAITWHDKAYPVHLRPLEDAPPTIFVRGNWDTGCPNTIAIVGTRQASQQGHEIAYRLGQIFAEHHYTVISGLAVGVDAQAHRGAMHVTDGKTVAVLGCGLERVYPPQNRQLARQIVPCGGLLSELPPNETVSTPALVSRNRLITGLSRATIIVEAGANSGALHAARFASVQGRLLCAVGLPEEGNYMLIRNGATLITPDLANIDTLLEVLAQEA